jgi:hypothetical protein
MGRNPFPANPSWIFPGKSWSAGILRVPASTSSPCARFLNRVLWPQSTTWDSLGEKVTAGRRAWISIWRRNNVSDLEVNQTVKFYGQFTGRSATESIKTTHWEFITVFRSQTSCWQWWSRKTGPIKYCFALFVKTIRTAIFVSQNWTKKELPVRLAECEISFESRY